MKYLSALLMSLAAGVMPLSTAAAERTEVNLQPAGDSDIRLPG